MKWLKKITGLDKEEQRLSEERASIEAERKRLEEAKLDLLKNKNPKEIATESNEPYIDILKVEINAENPSYGSFEMDWNNHFVNKLRSLGYPGDTDEIVVDLWFQSVCRNILLETYEQEAVNRDNIRYINRKDLGNGKTEVS